MAFLQGQEMVEAAGFDTRVIDNTATTSGMRCGKIEKTNPAGGTAYDVTKPVTLVVIDGVCSTSSVTPGATATPK
jgi:serine/threonine-protein kinase